MSYCGDISKDMNNAPGIGEGEPFSELMQFTGLHDKNGREIWEGDVLTESIYDIPAVYCGEDVSVVVFRYSAFRKVARDRYATMDVRGKYGEVYQGDLLEPYGGVLDNIRNVSVIGNIYENPELLSNV